MPKAELPLADEPRAERCETCRFWDQCDGLTDDFGYGSPCGWCHRYPPSPMAKALGRQPVTCDTDWCGEWRAKMRYVNDRPTEEIRKIRDDAVRALGPQCETARLMNDILAERGEE